jgi:hypothetical protein
MRRNNTPYGGSGPAPTKHATRILQLNSMNFQATRCSVTIVDQWIEVVADGDDPQINLPPMRGPGGKIQLRLSCVAEPEDALQVYWSNSDTGFSAERVQTLPCNGTLQTINLAFDLSADEALYIRIDPTTGAGRSRLRGTLGGMFTLLEQKPVPAAAFDEPCTTDLTPHGPWPHAAPTMTQAPGKSSAPAPHPRPRPPKSRARPKHTAES